jgi:hypothetical protein
VTKEIALISLTHFLKRRLNQKRKEREKFIELHLKVKIKEY